MTGGALASLRTPNQLLRQATTRSRSAGSINTSHASQLDIQRTPRHQHRARFRRQQLVRQCDEAIRVAGKIIIDNNTHRSSLAYRSQRPRQNGGCEVLATVGKVRPSFLLRVGINAAILSTCPGFSFSFFAIRGIEASVKTSPPSPPAAMGSGCIYS
jgi:hypothetical protein